MKKLTEEQLNVLVVERNEKGLAHTVEVMTNEELASYRINCMEAIERYEKKIAKSKTGGYIQKIQIELLDQLTGYVAYIDAKLSEKKQEQPKSAKIISLEEKVTKAVEKVKKCKDTITRHEKALVKKITALEKKVGGGVKNLEAVKWDESNNRGSDYYWDVCEIERKLDDIKGATNKLMDAERIQANWQDKLNLEIEKELFLEGNAPQVIKDFLEQWKAKAYEWYIRRYNTYQDLKAKLKKEEEEAKVELGIPSGRLPSRQQRILLKEKGLDFKSIEARKASVAGHIVQYMDTIYDEADRLSWLEKDLEKEKKAKMIDLIHRINIVVGTITDAVDLKICPKGNLNGFIVGEEGIAEVETIGAGGWNIQVFHFRTLVKPVK